MQGTRIMFQPSLTMIMLKHASKQHVRSKFTSRRGREGHVRKMFDPFLGVQEGWLLKQMCLRAGSTVECIFGMDVLVTWRLEGRLQEGSQKFCSMQVRRSGFLCSCLHL